MFEPLQKFFLRAANRYGMTVPIEAAKVCHDFRALIPEIFPSGQSPEINISPAFFRENTLVINVSTPAWAEAVVMRKHKIIEEMNNKAGKRIISNLRTQIKKT
ncbi:MAG: DciA family protein [Candidatus Peregrinibacteria bacterium]